MQQYLLIPVLSIFLAGSASAQNQVRGTVSDAPGSPLTGVNVVVKGTTGGAMVGTITDVDGYYEIDIPAGRDTLIFSYIGYTPLSVAVGGRAVVDITLGESRTFLDEVVVVGYGVQKKRVSTGAISQLSSENIDAVKVQNLQSALEGQVTGLIVNESSGQPGASKSILIRGVGTNGDNSPLFIVDGLQVSGIDNINPADVESVDVLKDAASGAIYGARAANGVVIITTKKGSEGKGTISYDGFYSQSQPWKLPEMLGSADYINLTREKFANGNQTSSLNSLGFPAAGEFEHNTNWMDAIFEPAVFQSHRLSASGNNIYVSLEYSDQEGVIGGDKSNYKRYAARINGSKEINDYVTIGENLYINRVENRSIGVNDAFGTVIADAFAYDPLTPLFDEQKQYGFAQSRWVQKEYINPLSRLFLANGSGHGDQILGNIYLEISPLKQITFRSDLGIDYSWYNFRNFTPDYAFHDAFVNVSNDVSQGYGFGESYQVENYINYRNAFGAHNVDVILGTSFRNSNAEWSGGSSSSIPDAVKFDPNWQFVDAGEDSTDLSYGGGAVEYNLISYYGRVLYDYQGKYLFSATIRRDGSSNFGANNRWGVFPSFSLGWVLSEEPFFGGGPVSFLKLRASWGKNGNDRISPLAYAATVENVFTYAFGQNPALYTGATLATPPNPDIKWEESSQLDIGIELRMFDDKLTAEFDYYVKTTEDLLMSEVIPGYIGATNNPVSNLGEIRNRGIEALVGYRINLGQLRLKAGVNYTHFRNEVINVAGETGFIQGYSWPVRNTPITRMTEGFPVGHFVGYKTDGIFQSQAEVFSHLNADGNPLQPNAHAGDIRFVDVNGDGVINSDDITHIGSPWPDHIFGMNLSAEYKGLDVGLLFSSQVGHDIFRAYERSDITFTNYQTFWLDRWTEENPGSAYPRLVSNDPNNNQRPSDFYLEEGSFLRLRNLQIGYSIPNRVISKAKLAGLRIYVSGTNIFTLTNYNGFDPDIGSNGWILDTGIDKGFYPSNRTIGGGITITM